MLVMSVFANQDDLQKFEDEVDKKKAVVKS